MRKDLIIATCVGILGVTLLSNASFAGEKEYFTEEDIQDGYRTVESLPIAPAIGNITRANVWIKEAEDRVKAQEATKIRAKMDTAKIVVAKVPAPKTELTSVEPKLLPAIITTKVPTNEKPADIYKVQKGDTLFGIVKKLEYKDIDKTRTAVALWQSNKDSFIAGNLNGIIPGKTLELEEVAKNIEGIDTKTAYGIVQSQWKEWKNRTASANTDKNKNVTDEIGKVTSKSTNGKRVAEKTAVTEKTPADSIDSETKEENKSITVSNLVKN